MSESFLGNWNDIIFFIPRNLWNDFNTMIANFQKTIPSQQIEAIKLLDSNHTDQGDDCVTDEFLIACLNKFVFKTSFDKKYGSNVEFYEYITMLWLKFLYRIDFHDNTFDFDKIYKRSQQFRASEVQLAGLNNNDKI